MKNDHLDVDRLKAELLGAITPHVPFDGWSEPAFRAAVADLGVDEALARIVCPRGAVDLAVEYHRAGDRAMEAAIAAADFTGMKFRDKIAAAVLLRLEAVDRELVSRGASVFALPQNAATGSKLIWETADRIWAALGDTSRDYNWYTKRMTLSAVYGATVLFWLGDDSEGGVETRAFLDRRIEGVMTFEKVKGKVLGLPFLKEMLGAVKAPEPADLPGRMGGAR